MFFHSYKEAHQVLHLKGSFQRGTIGNTVDGITSLKLTQKATDFILFIRTFLSLHFSYGFGYLHGILNFIILKRKPSQKQMKLSR